jgi:hypothetical protein
MKSFLTSAPRLFATLAFFVVCSTTTMNTRMVVVVTAAKSSSGYHNNFLALAATIPSSFVLPDNIMSSCSSSCNIIGGGNRRRHRHHHQPKDLLSNPTIAHGHDDGLMIQNHRRFCLRQHRIFSMSSDNQSDNNNHNPFNDDESNQSPSGKKNNSSKNTNNNNNNNMVIMTDELSWRVAKLRLEEANTKRFLNRPPLKMSYLQSRQFIQRNWGPIRSKKEFEDLVSNGDIRTPYISKRPEEYYGRRGEWISWEHYLLGECECSSGSSNGIGTNSTDTSGGGGGGGRSQDVVLKWQ